MSLPRAVRWTLPPLALLALAGWIASSSGSSPPDTQPEEKNNYFFSPPGRQDQVAAGPAMAHPPAHVDRAAAVARIVAQKNGEAGRDQESFTRAGWKMVEVPPPDAKLVAFDPSLLGSRERDLRQQIASTTPSSEDAENLARIAREAREEATQVAAVEALGRIRSDESQDALLDLLKELPDGGAARREIAPLLRPRDLADPRAAELARLLDSRELNAVERKQIAFTLALIGLRDGSELKAPLSDEARALVASMTSLARLSP
jgi:hypothetical protein